MTAVLCADTPAEAQARLPLMAPAMPPNVYAFTGAKGGVGTSSLAVNVAAALARGHGRTLLLDLHPGDGDLDAFFETRTRYSLADACAAVAHAERGHLHELVTAVAAGLDLLPARQREPSPVSEAWRFVVAAAAGSYAHVVVDLAPALAAAACASSPPRTIVVATQEMLALRRADRLLRDIRRRSDTIPLLVVNRFDEGERPVDEIERLLDVTVTQTFPNAYHLMAQAIARGRPLDRRAPHPLVDAIDGFAARLAGREVVAPRRSRSWLDALPLRRAASASSMPDCRQRAR